MSDPKIDGEEFFEQISNYLPVEERKTVRRAFDLARKEHGQDRRRSGELFFTHPLTVATYLAEHNLDAPAIIAALLHDVAEDTSVSVDEIKGKFGDEVGQIVYALTKFDHVTVKAKMGRDLSDDEVKTATIQKLFETMANDVRVGIVKIFDRLHNMRTIQAMPPYKQAEKARETMQVYAPLANRLGMWQVKKELEEISLRILEPERVEQIKISIEKRDRKHARDFPHLERDIREVLKNNKLEVVNVIPSPEDIGSIFKEFANIKNPESKIVEGPPRYSVLLTDVKDCYMALGAIHAAWRPVPGEFDDYIAAPKDNLYRSLHTTVVYKGRQVKVRFRTIGMQITSQSGVLSKWVGRNPMTMNTWSKEMSERYDNILTTIGENLKGESIDEGVSQVLTDVFTNQIIAYTPEGDKRELPQGSTPVDFAYTIHTAVGHSCRGAKVNGEEKSLTYQLQDGDSVEITKKGVEPQRAWLDEDLGYLNSRAVRSKVRRWFRRLPDDKAIVQGRMLLHEELALLGEGKLSHEKVAGWMGYDTPKLLYYDLGRAELLPTDVATKVLTESWSLHPTRSIGQQVQSRTGEWFVIQNAGDRSLRLCGTCNPRPGDEIIGFIRRDGIVTVHSTSCRTVKNNPIRERRLKLRWAENRQVVTRPITIQINVHDRDGLLNDITEVLRLENSNITQICSRTVNYRATIVLGVEAGSPRQVVRILHRIKEVVNVVSVQYFSQGGFAGPADPATPSITCPATLLQNGINNISKELMGK